jgi:hypothetical protein
MDKVFHPDSKPFKLIVVSAFLPVAHIDSPLRFLELASMDSTLIGSSRFRESPFSGQTVPTSTAGRGSALVRRSYLLCV